MALQKPITKHETEYEGYWRVEGLNLVVSELWAEITLFGFSNAKCAAAYRTAKLTGADSAPYEPLEIVRVLPDRATVFAVVSSTEGENLATLLYNFAKMDARFEGAEDKL